MARHFSRRQLLAFLSMSEPDRDTFEEVLEHLLSECSICKAELMALARPREQPTHWNELVPRAVEAARSQEATWTRFFLIAEAEVAELLALPAGARRLKIERAYTRFRNPALVDLLLEESKQRIAVAPAEAYDLADCAHIAALRISTNEVPHTIAMTAIARARAYRANALRVQGSLHQAETMVAAAVMLFDSEGTGDALVHGELMEISASVARDQRRFVDAEAFLARAQGLYAQCEEHQHLARVLVSKGTLLLEMDLLEQALTVTEDALATMDPQADPWLHLCAVHNAAHYLAELERFPEARQRMHEHAALYAQFPESGITIRRRWTEGRMDRLEGHIPSAEAAFKEVRSRFAAMGVGYDAALVSLDLALLYVEQGKTAEVKRVAEELVGVFMAEDIHREALAAVRLFQEAARQDAVTASMLGELMLYLKRVRGARESVVS